MKNYSLLLFILLAGFASYSQCDSVNLALGHPAPKDYQWIDSLPPTGINYYRLRQVDLDGKSSYSKVVSVAMLSSGASQLSIYPNPVRDQVNIVAPDGLHIRAITLYNSMGVELKKYDGFSGSSSVQISTHSLSSGIYTLKVITNKGMDVIRLLK